MGRDNTGPNSTMAARANMSPLRRSPSMRSRNRVGGRFRRPVFSQSREAMSRDRVTVSTTKTCRSPPSTCRSTGEPQRKSTTVGAARCEPLRAIGPAIHARNLRQLRRFERELRLTLQVHRDVVLRRTRRFVVSCASGRANEVDTVVPDAFLNAVRLGDGFRFFDFGE